jgi:hypothetical protein
VNGEIRHFASDVPQGHVHGADGIGGDRAIHLPHLLPDGPDIQRVHADDGRFDEFHERPCIRIGPLSGGAEKSVAFDACIGLHGHDPQ